MSEPLPVCNFADVASAAKRFEIIKERMKGLIPNTRGLKKREQKIIEKKASEKQQPQKNLTETNGLERVERRVLGEPIAALVQPGERAEFIAQQRQRIAQVTGRNIDDSDSEDTLSAQSDFQRE